MLTVQSLSKVFGSDGDRTAGGIRQASFKVEKGSFFTLLGPSGCGKTTTLRCVAGLEQPSEGTITIDGTTVFDGARDILVPVHRRNIGMVFQSYAIWPHMSVFDNAAFPLRFGRRKVKSSEVKRRVGATLEAVGLADLAARAATSLSGGQQQRLALARAIVHEPSLLLLDEPLSNLDARLRDEMRLELKRLQQRLRITTLYVTHDQAEALALSDALAVLDNGEIVQIGTPDDIYHRPKNRFVAGFVGWTNLLPGMVVEGTRTGVTVRLDDGRIIRCAGSENPPRSGSRVTVSVRPEAIKTLAVPPAQISPEQNLLPGHVRNRIFLGNISTLQIAAADTSITVIADPAQHYALDSEITLGFPVAGAIALTS
jgi:ABC-type Fe3+/spermidine/putrescine transport system ATPase subunit